MTDVAFDDRPARTTATLAAVTAAVVAALVGVAAGFGRTTLLATVGCALLAAGAWALEEESLPRQAAGSVAATAGAALLFGVFVVALGGAGGWVLFVLFLGVAFVAVDAAVGLGRDRDRTLSDVMRDNVSLVLIGLLFAAVVHVTLVSGAVPALFGGVLAVSTATPLAGFVTLQVFALCVALLVPRAGAVLDRWLPDERADRDGVLDAVETAGIEIGDVPRAYWAALGVQVLATLVPQANALFGAVFGVLGPAFTSGVLHAAVGLCVLTLLGVLVLGVVQRWAVTWLGAVPVQTMAIEAGGITSILLAVLASVAFELLPDHLLVDALEPVVVDHLSTVGVPTVVLGGLLVALLVVVALLNLATPLSFYGFAPDRASGFAMGSAFIFVGALGATALDVPPFVTFVGVAGALLVWDLGSHATSVGRRLGQAADTRRSEFVHVTGSSVVLAGAAVVATAGYYVVVPALAPANTPSAAGGAVLSLVLVLTAVLAFVSAVHLRGRANGA